MYTVTRYISNDGTEFDNWCDCEEYELSCLLEEKGIKLFDKNRNPITDFNTEIDAVFMPNDDMEIVYRIYKYCGQEIPCLKGHWFWKWGTENRQVCSHCESYEQGVCLRNGQCNNGNWFTEDEE